MELLTLTSEIRQMFEIKSAYININNTDVIVMLKELSDDKVCFTCPNLEIATKQCISLFFTSKFGKVECKVSIDCFYIDGIFFNVEGTITANNNNDFFIAFMNLILDLFNQKKRKEQRILCTKKNLKILGLINIIFFTYKNNTYKGVVKDISFSGMKILTNPLLLEEENEKFCFKLSFVQPVEKYMFWNVKTIRKNLFSYDGYDFAEIVFQLPDNIKFRNRINDFLLTNEEKIQHSR